MRLVRVVDDGPDCRVEIVWERGEIKGMPFHTLVVEYAEEGAGRGPRIISMGAPELGPVGIAVDYLLTALVASVLDNGNPGLAAMLAGLRLEVAMLLRDAVQVSASVGEPGLN